MTIPDPVPLVLLTVVCGAWLLSGVAMGMVLHKLDMKIGSEKEKSIQKAEKIVKVIINSKGKVILDGSNEIKNRRDLQEKFSIFLKLNKNSTIQIIPHEESNYQKVAMVLTEAKLAGFKSISFVDIEKFLN